MAEFNWSTFTAEARKLGWLDPEIADRTPVFDLDTAIGRIKMGPRMVAMCIDPREREDVIYRETYWATGPGKQNGWWNPRAEEPLDLDIIGVMRVPEYEVGDESPDKTSMEPK